MRKVSPNISQWATVTNLVHNISTQPDILWAVGRGTKAKPSHLFTHLPQRGLRDFLWMRGKPYYSGQMYNLHKRTMMEQTITITQNYNNASILTGCLNALRIGRGNEQWKGIVSQSLQCRRKLGVDGCRSRLKGTGLALGSEREAFLALRAPVSLCAQGDSLSRCLPLHLSLFSDFCSVGYSIKSDFLSSRQYVHSMYS